MYIVGGSSSEGASYSTGFIVHVVHAAGIVAMTELQPSRSEVVLEIATVQNRPSAMQKLPCVNVLC